MNKPTVNVVDVKYPPAIGKVEMMSGIRTKEEAVTWAMKRGYPTVYLLKSRERVYADRTTSTIPRVDKSKMLFALDEQGSAALEYAILTALVLGILYLLGKVLGVPW